MLQEYSNYLQACACVCAAHQYTALNPESDVRRVADLHQSGLFAAGGGNMFVIKHLIVAFSKQ